MYLSAFPIVMGIFWFNIFVVILSFLSKKDKFIISFTLFPIILLVILSLVRLFLNFENSHAKIISSEIIYPTVVNIAFYSVKISGIQIKLYQVVLFIWLVVIAFLLMKRLYELYRVKKMLKNIPTIKNDNDNLILNEILKEKNIKKSIKLYRSSDISSPMLICLIKPTIYIPNLELSNKELEYILLHEVNHYIRKDYLKKLFMTILQIVFWWNPFMKVLLNRYDHILEIQCDIETTKNMNEEEKIIYLENITKVIKNSLEPENRTMNNYVINLIGESNIYNLKQRFNLVLGYKKNKKIYNIMACTAMIIMFLLSYSFTIQPEFTAPEGYSSSDQKEDSKFILKNEDGKYEIYIDGELIKIVENIDEEYREFPIFEKEVSAQ